MAQPTHYQGAKKEPMAHESLPPVRLVEPEEAAPAAAPLRRVDGQTGGASVVDRLRSLKLDKEGSAAPRFAPARTRAPWWLWTACLILLTSTVVLGLKVYQTTANSSPVAVTDEIAAITVGGQATISIVLDSSGYIVAKSQVQVSPKVAGMVLELPIREGMKVKKGDLLARLDDVQYRTNYEQAKATLALTQARLDELRHGSREEEIQQGRASLEQARARRDLLASEFQRTEKLFAKKSVSPSEFDRAKSDYQEADSRLKELTQVLRLIEKGPREERILAAAAEVEQTKAAMAQSQYWFENTRVLAPISGTILQKKAELGETVRPESFGGERGLSASLCVMADLSQMEAEVDVQERVLHRVFVGQPCRIQAEAYSDRTYEGRLDRLLPIANRQRGVVQARITILSPDDRLLPDMNCNVKFLKEAPATKPEAIRVPETAVIRDGAETAVFVLDGELARRRVIELGSASDQTVEVRHGLRPGDVVLLPEGRSLRDGQTVHTRLR